MASPYPALVNIVGYQLIWLLAVAGQTQALPLIILLLAGHFVLCRRQWRDELLFVGACTCIGVTVDSFLTLAGVFQFPLAGQLLLPCVSVPLWLVCIWISFACTLRHSLRFLLPRPLLAILLGALGGPASYYAGARLGGVSFGYSMELTLSLLMLLWALLMPLLLMLHYRLWSRRQRQQLVLIS